METLGDFSNESYSLTYIFKNLSILVNVEGGDMKVKIRRSIKRIYKILKKKEKKNLWWLVAQPNLVQLR